MHRFSTTCLGLGVLVALACGAPAELDDSLYPGAYTGGETGSSGGPLTGAVNAASPAPPTPSGNVAAPGAGGAAVPPPAADDGPEVGAPAPIPEAPATAGELPAAEGAVEPAAGAGAGGCPDDITVLFNRPAEEGGCGGGACHVPGATAPDLVSPNPETRLVGVTSACQQRPYIGQGDSFLAEKISGAPECGLAMPFFMPQALNADDEACILAWIDEVSGG